MLAVVSLHSCFESCHCAVFLHVYWYVDLGRCCPNNNDACATVLLLEVADILAESLNHLPASLAVLNVVAVEALSVVLVEGSLHRHHLFQLLAHGVDILLLQHLGIHSCLISILWIYVPCSEYDIVEIGKRHDVLIVQILLVCALANTNLVILSH